MLLNRHLLAVMIYVNFGSIIIWMHVWRDCHNLWRCLWETGRGWPLLLNSRRLFYDDRRPPLSMVGLIVVRIKCFNSNAFRSLIEEVLLERRRYVHWRSPAFGFLCPKVRSFTLHRSLRLIECYEVLLVLVVPPGLLLLGRLFSMLGDPIRLLSLVERMLSWIGTTRSC